MLFLGLSIPSTPRGMPPGVPSIPSLRSSHNNQPRPWSAWKHEMLRGSFDTALCKIALPKNTVQVLCLFLGERLEFMLVIARDPLESTRRQTFRSTCQDPHLPCSQESSISLGSTVVVERCRERPAPGPQAQVQRRVESRQAWHALA